MAFKLILFLFGSTFGENPLTGSLFVCIRTRYSKTKRARKIKYGLWFMYEKLRNVSPFCQIPSTEVCLKIYVCVCAHDDSKTKRTMDNIWCVISIPKLKISIILQTKSVNRKSTCWSARSSCWNTTPGQRIDLEEWKWFVFPHRL